MDILSYLKSLILCILILTCHFGFASNVDSLKAVLEKTHGNAEKARILNELASELKWNDIDASYEYAKEALKYAKLGNTKPDVARAFNRIGYYFSRKNEQDSAISYFEKALAIYQKEKDLKNIGDTYNFLGRAYAGKEMLPDAKKCLYLAVRYQKQANIPGNIANSLSNLGKVFLLEENYDSALTLYKETLHYDSVSSDTVNVNIAITLNDIGGVYYFKGNFAKAIDNYLYALKIFEIFEHNAGISRMLNNIGNIYLEQKNYDKAFDYFGQSVEIKEKLGDQLALANTFCSMGKIKLIKKDIDDADTFLIKALDLFKELNNTRGLATTYRYIGEIELIKGHNKQSEAFLTKALELSTQVNEKSSIAECLMLLGKISSLEGKHSESLIQMNKALDISKEIGLLELEKNIQENIANAYVAAGDPLKAVSHLKQYIAINDSLFKIENRKILFDLAKKYETEKKELELQMATKDKQLKDSEIKKQKLMRNAIIIGIVLLLIILSMIFNNAIQQIIGKSE
jgi:tetratricopeptide (TPR) repeat protein